MTIYDFEYDLNNGRIVRLEEYRDKNILIVNTASNCGYTKQYASLVELKNILKEDLAIIAFPCNQFGNQEPGSDDQIKEFCKTNYNVNFDIASKTEVNGDNAHPLWTYLRLVANNKNDISWNFEKFLIDKQGNITHYNSNFEPLQFIDIISEKK